MSSETHVEGGWTRGSGPRDPHHVDDVILRARRERALWLGELGRRAAAWLKSRAPGGLTTLLARRRRVLEVRELLALDSRTLADIGLRREDLWGVVNGDVSLERLVQARTARREAAVAPLRRPEPVLSDNRSDLERAA